MTAARTTPVWATQDHRQRRSPPNQQSGTPAGTRLGLVPEEPEPTTVAGPGRARPVPRSNWWREVLLIAAFYGLYTLVRNIRGARPVSVAQAFTNAQRVVHAERRLGIFHESTVQHWYLHNAGFIQFWNDFYGIAHFVGVIVVLVILFFYFPLRYRRWRNTLAIATFIALIGFSVFPLAPPRLLPPRFGFIDTLQVYGGLWSFHSGPINSVSNQYAAMPSLHTAWALWAALATVGILRPWWAKVLVFLFPLATVFALVVTANHYFLDEIAGVVVLGFAYAVAQRSTAWLEHRRDRRTAGPGTCDNGRSR